MLAKQTVFQHCFFYQGAKFIHNCFSNVTFNAVQRSMLTGI